MNQTAQEKIVADELRKNLGFRLLVTLAYSPKDYSAALPEAAEVFAEIAVKALRQAGHLSNQGEKE